MPHPEHRLTQPLFHTMDHFHYDEDDNLVCCIEDVADEQSYHDHVCETLDRFLAGLGFGKW
jgi:hypothetical protein